MPPPVQVGRPRVAHGLVPWVGCRSQGSSPAVVAVFWLEYQKKRVPLALEDSDTHARRNVVLLSASVLLAAWLKQDLPIILGWLGVSGLPPDTAERVWAALFVLLAYLLARYHFTPDRAERWLAGAKAVSAIQNLWMKPWARRETFRKTNMNRAERGFGPISGSARDFCGIPWLRSHSFRWVDYQYRFEEEDDESFNERYRDDFPESGRLPLWLALWNSTATLVLRVLLSRAGLEVAVPYGLAAVALAICSVRAGWIVAMTSKVSQWSLGG